jgi:predicted nucleic acid-binding protein
MCEDRQSHDGVDLKLLGCGLEWNVVDSSAWLEYFADGPNASVIAKPIESTRSLLVPSLSLFEVFKRVSQQRCEDDALRAVAVMEQGSVVDLDRATLWTQDADFDRLPGVKYYAKRMC